MKASDEEEYGSFYSTNPNRGSSGNPARYRYRDYSPSRGHGHHHQQSSQGQGPGGPSSSSSSSSSTLVDSSPYAIPPPNRSFTRTPPYGASGGSRNMVEYAPPCCHPFYHPPPPPIPLHPSPSHFNTIPHPPLQYRYVPILSV